MLQPDPHPDRLAAWSIGVFLLGLALLVLAGITISTLWIDRAIAAGAALLLLAVALLLMRYGRARRERGLPYSPPGGEREPHRVDRPR